MGLFLGSRHSSAGREKSRAVWRDERKGRLCCCLCKLLPKQWIPGVLTGRVPGMQTAFADVA